MNAQRYINYITLIATGKLVKKNNQKLARVYNQVCENWKMKPRSKFSLLKYQLIHIKRIQNIDYTAGVRLWKNHLIQGKSKVVNFSIIFQSKLS